MTARPGVRGALLAVLLTTTAGCAGTGATTSGAPSADPPAATGELPSAHVHGIARNPADGLAYLASHDGLFRYEPDGPVRVGPVIDLMGFSVASADQFYASGHPGPGVDLPQPVGLIESVDGGETWTGVSLGGESDFHSLTAGPSGVVGFDGTLRRSADGISWQALEPPGAPYALTASPDGMTLVVTSETGPFRSADAGTTWEQLVDAPLLQVVDWAEGDTVVGVTPTGTVAVSDDGGVTWAPRAELGEAPQAVGAGPSADGGVEVLVVTTDRVLVSADGAETFEPFGTGS